MSAGQKLRRERARGLSARAEERGGEPSANRGAGPGGDPVGELRRRLSDLPGYVRAVLLFGSLARGEAGERSDVDLLVLHSGAPARDPVERRRLLYKLVAERLEGRSRRSRWSTWTSSGS